MDLLDRALAYLAENPDSSAKTIANGIGANDRDVFRVLHLAAFDGKCQCWKSGNGPWMWEIPGTGSVIAAPVDTATIPKRQEG